MFVLTRMLVPTNRGEPPRMALQHGAAFASSSAPSCSFCTCGAHKRSTRRPRPATDGIVACARELAVMGKHHLGFVGHLLSGSVAEKAVRHAPCPVLIGQKPEHDFVVTDTPAH